MPMATSSRPWSVPAMSTSSSSGMTDSPPSRRNRLWPPYVLCGEASGAAGARRGVPRGHRPPRLGAEPLLADVLRLEEGLEGLGGVEPAEDVLLLVPVGPLVHDPDARPGAPPLRR